MKEMKAIIQHKDNAGRWADCPEECCRLAVENNPGAFDGLEWTRVSYVQVEKKPTHVEKLREALSRLMAANYALLGYLSPMDIPDSAVLEAARASLAWDELLTPEDLA